MSDSIIPPRQACEQEKNLTFDELKAQAELILDDAQSATSVEYSDDAIALKFTEEHDDLRYTASRGLWRQWNGHRWVEDATLRVYDRARAVCRDTARGCDKATTARALNSSKTISAVETIARSDRRHAMAADQWDADAWLLNTPKGAIDLVTGAMRPCDPRDHCTKSTTCAPGGECPLWLKFLDRVTAGNIELQEFLQRMCGYCLTGSTRDHALFFLYGTGSNGKSTFIDTLSGILAGYATTAPMEAFTATQNERHPTDIATLAGARLVTSIETEEGRKWAESRIKALTGGDKISARFMRQDPFEFKPQFKLLIAGNHRPGLRSVDEAMRRRMNLIPFVVTIPPEDRNLKLAEELRAEWPGILKWMLDGCLDWQRGGLGPPPIVRDATDVYLAAEDVLAAWIQEECEDDVNAWTPSNALFEHWKKWADASGEFTGSQRRFAQNLEAKGYQPHRPGKHRGFLGIRIVGELL